MTKRPSLPLSICLIAATIAAVGLLRPGNNPAPAASAPAADIAGASASVEISGFQFPPTSAVAAGATIDVTNLDGAPHTITATDGSFDTGTIGGGATGSFAGPTVAGTYEFFCAIHPSMTGSLTVS